MGLKCRRGGERKSRNRWRRRGGKIKKQVNENMEATIEAEGKMQKPVQQGNDAEE